MDHLSELIDLYLEESLKEQRLTLQGISRHRIWIMGDTSLSFLPIGYAQFLKASGIPSPTLGDLNTFRIGRYWEFLAQHLGLIHAVCAMRALRGFWNWCVATKRIQNLTLPPDLRDRHVGDFYRIHIVIREKTRKGGRS